MSVPAGPVDGSKMKSGQALQHIKQAVRNRAISVSLHAEKDRPERGITVAELMRSLLAAASAQQQGRSSVWEVRGPADQTMASLTRKRFILARVASQGKTVIITCRREP